jgi:hypothetical protein
MFALAPDASKVAFATLVRQLERWGFGLIDCQQQTHLERFGRCSGRAAATWALARCAAPAARRVALRYRRSDGADARRPAPSRSILELERPEVVSSRSAWTR